MSSILKALKKIEETTPAADAADPQPAPGPHRLWIPPHGRGRRKAILIGCVLLAATVAAAGVFIFGRGAGDRPAPAAVSTAGGPNAVRAKIADSPAPTAGGGESGPAVTADPAAAAPAVAAPPPLPKRPAAQTLPARPVTRPASRESAGAPAAERAAPGAAAPRSAAESLSRLDNSKLKVMAIAWYADPAKRIAVINGSLVKEGESVEGYKVTQIRKDDVIVSDGSRSWRVEFGLKAPP